MVGVTEAAMRSMRDTRNKVVGYASGKGNFMSENVRPGITRSSALAAKYNFQSIMREGTPDEKSALMSDMWNGYKTYNKEAGDERLEQAGGIGSLELMHPAQKLIVTAICKGVPVDPDKYAFLVAMALQPGKLWFSGAMGASSSEIIAMTCSRYDAVFEAQENSEAQIAFPTTIWVKYGAKKKSLRYGIPLDKMLLYANRAVDIVVSTFICALVDAIVKTTVDFLFEHATPVGIEEGSGQSILRYVGSSNDPQLFMSAMNECKTRSQSNRNMVVWPHQSRIEPPGPSVDLSHFDELVPEGGIMPWASTIGPAMTTPMRSTVVNGHYVMPVSDDKRVVTWWTAKRDFTANFQAGDFVFRGQALDMLFPDLKSDNQWEGGPADWEARKPYENLDQNVTGIPCMWNPTLPDSMRDVWKQGVKARGFRFSRDQSNDVTADKMPQVPFLTQGDFVHGAGVSAAHMAKVFKRLTQYNAVLPLTPVEAFTSVLSMGESSYPLPRDDDGDVFTGYNQWMGKSDIANLGVSIATVIQTQQYQVGLIQTDLKELNYLDSDFIEDAKFDWIDKKLQEGEQAGAGSVHTYCTNLRATPLAPLPTGTTSANATFRQLFGDLGTAITHINADPNMIAFMEEFREMDATIVAESIKSQRQQFNRMCAGLRDGSTSVGGVSLEILTIHPKNDASVDKTVNPHFWAGFWKSASRLRNVWDSVYAASRLVGEMNMKVTMDAFDFGAVLVCLENFFVDRSVSWNQEGANFEVWMKPADWRELLNAILRALSVLYGQGGMNDRDQAALMGFMYWPWVKQFAYDVIEKNGIMPFAMAMLIRRELITSSLLAFTSNYGHPAAPSTVYTELTGSPFYARWGNSEMTSEFQKPTEAMVRAWSNMMALAPNTRSENYDTLISGGAINLSQLFGLTEPPAMIVGGVVQSDRRIRPFEADKPRDIFVLGRDGPGEEIPASVSFIFGMPGKEFSRRPLHALHESDEDTGTMIGKNAQYVQFMVKKNPDEYIWPVSYTVAAKVATNDAVRFTADDAAYHKKEDEISATFNLKVNHVVCWDDKASGHPHGFAERRADVYANQCVFNVRRPNDVLDQATLNGDGPLDDHIGGENRTFVISHSGTRLSGGPLIPNNAPSGPISWLNSAVPYANGGVTG